MDLEALREKCAACTACPLSTTRTHSVFGTGDTRAELMFVGEAPGEQEDLTGTPFVGKAGQLLDKFLEAVEIPREKVYIANILKCRPPQNRDPLPEEEDACIGFLREQVRIIRPKIIVCLGRVAAIRFIDPNFKVTKEHGNFIEKDGRLVMGTFHPAALLRNPRNKPDAMEDFFALQSKIKEICPETYSL